MLNGASGKSRLLHQHYIPVNPKPYVTIVTIVYTDIHIYIHLDIYTVYSILPWSIRTEGLRFWGLRFWGLGLRVLSLRVS